MHLLQIGNYVRSQSLVGVDNVFAVNECNCLRRLEAEYHLLLCGHAVEVVVDVCRVGGFASHFTGCNGKFSYEIGCRTCCSTGWRFGCSIVCSTGWKTCCSIGCSTGWKTRCRIGWVEDLLQYWVEDPFPLILAPCPAGSDWYGPR